MLKPSERTPLLAARLVELLEEAGLPKGVLNLVNGAHEVVNGLLEHPDVKAISFVGLTAGGRICLQEGNGVFEAGSGVGRGEKSFYCVGRREP